MKNYYDTSKEFVCGNCMIFLDLVDLVKGCCPECRSDESLFANDLAEEDEEFEEF